MSDTDAAAFVTSVAAGAGIAAGTVIVFVDLRERTNKKGKAVGLLEATQSLDDLPAGMVMQRALLHVGDVMICRVVSRHRMPASVTDAVVRQWTASMNEAVRVDGVGAADAMLPAASSSSSSGTDAALVLVPFFAYERKTTSDLVSSIQPSRGAPGSAPSTQRWLDQKARLSAFCQATGCLPALVIEGYMEHAQTARPLGPMSEKRAHSELHEANRVHGLPFWNSASVHDTGRLLVRDARLLLESDDGSGGGGALLLPSGWTRLGTIDQLTQQAADGASSLVVRKSEQHTVQSWWRAALTLVPGVSAATAAALTAEWPTLASMQAAAQVRETTKGRELLVADVRIGADGKRRVGPALAKRLVERICPLADEADESVAKPVKKRK